MFEQVEAVLRQTSLLTDSDGCRARCLFHIRPLTYALAKAISPSLPDLLFDSDGSMRPIPYLSLKNLRFSRQSLTFSVHPNPASPRERIPNVSIGGVGVFRKRALQSPVEEFQLLLNLNFLLCDWAAASRLFQTMTAPPVYLSLRPMQGELRPNSTLADSDEIW